MELHQLLQTVVAVDDTPVEIVQVGSCEPASIQRHEWTQLRRDDRDYIEDHPFRLVARFAKALNDTETLGVLQLFLSRSFRLHPFANVEAERFNIDALEQLLHTLGAHHCDEFAGELLI